MWECVDCRHGGDAGIQGLMSAVSFALLPLDED